MPSPSSPEAELHPGHAATVSPTLGRLAVVAAALCWSLGGVVVKSDALQSLDPLSIAVYRSLFAGLALLPFVRPSRWRLPPVLILAAVVFGLMIGLYLVSMRTTTAANAIFLMCSASLWLVPLGALVLRERPGRRAVTSVLLALPGIAAIALFGHGQTPAEWTGVGLGLASGLLYAVTMVLMRRLRGLDALWLSAVNNLGGALTLAALTLASGRTIAQPDVHQALVLAGFGIIQMAIPYALFAVGLHAIGVVEAGLIALLEPILNPIWVAVGTGELPHLATVLGGLSLLAAVAWQYLGGSPGPTAAVAAHDDGPPPPEQGGDGPRG